jgi:hypothetical protein
VPGHRLYKTGRGKRQNKRKIGACKSIPAAKGKWLAYAAAFRKDRLLLLLIHRHCGPLEQKTRVAEDRLRLFMFD